MPPARFVRLTPEEDNKLRAIEQNPLLKPKVRLRAQVLRLSGRGERVVSIAAYTGRSEASVLRDLARWEERGFEGLADATAPGNPRRVTEQVRTFMEVRLSEERTWNASQLAEEIGERFGIVVGAPRPCVRTWC
jgi:transposase